ncbi:VAR3 [Symbiodinium sp. CCMP2456]|nr:VAR3 [Symbiodinium sp. CCMP2456]
MIATICRDRRGCIPLAALRHPQTIHYTQHTFTLCQLGPARLTCLRRAENSNCPSPSMANVTTLAVPGAIPQGTPGGRNPGDWSCQFCKAGNFARNISCKTCGAQRPIAGSYGTPLPNAGQTDPFESPTGQPGDWSCPKCRAVCFARNPVCGRCNCPKPESIEEYNLLAAAAVGAIPGVKASVKGYVPPTAELKTDATSPWARQWAAGPAGGMFVGETNLPEPFLQTIHPAAPAPIDSFRSLVK